MIWLKIIMILVFPTEKLKVDILPIQNGVSHLKLQFSVDFNGDFRGNIGVIGLFSGPNKLV